MKPTLPRVESTRIVVVGDVMLDRYWQGSTSRISPEAPVPVVKVEHCEERPGGAANVALNIAALGAAASLVAATGQDEAAASLAARLGAANVVCDFEQLSGMTTIIKLRVISRQQQLLRLDFEDDYHGIAVDALNDKVKTHLAQADCLILSDYGKGTLRDHQTLIRLAKDQGIPVLVDPHGHDFARYRGATLLTPNLSEFEAVVGHCRHEADLVEKGLTLMADCELQALLITRGERGMTLLRPDQPAFHLPARAREVYDVTGAGDTVIAVLATALGAGAALEQAVALANMAAGIVVGKLGTAAISAPELRREIMREQGAERGVVSEAQLLTSLADCRARGECIVFTNGCFDILHAGHVGYLAEARQLGDRLIVGVNSDASVTRLKGVGRPVTPLERRMAVLAGLEAVDWVVPFTEDTPLRLLEQIRPDVLVKGGDYQLDQIVGADQVRAQGGEVRVLSLLDNCSTSAIVSKIRGG